MSVAGPFVKSKNTNVSEDTQFLYKETDRKVRFTRVLPYLRAKHTAPNKQLLNTLSAFGNQPLALTDSLYASAYDTFWGKMYSRANLMLTLWEADKSLAMIRKRALTLASAAKALRRRDIFAFARALGISPHSRHTPKGRRPLKSSSDLGGVWLEYTFGWVPLIQDIHDSIDVLQQDFDMASIKARKRGVIYDHYTEGPGGIRSHDLVAEYFFYMGAKMKVNNPNLFLANQLGLLNPVAVAWDAVPFSFVVDWFLPVTKFLNTFQNGVGLDVTNCYTGRGYSASGYMSWNHPNVPGYGPRSVGQGRSYWINRGLVGSFPRPSLMSRLRLPKADTWLAITSLSLLAQQLNGLKGRR